MENINPNNKHNERVRVDGMNFEIRPNWKDNDINEITKYKLPPEKQLEKIAQRVSKNYHRASTEYRSYLESLRSNEKVFWNLCRSVSPVRSKSKEKKTFKTSYKRKSVDDSNENNFQSSNDTKTVINSRGRSRRVQNSKVRESYSLPPNLDHGRKDNSYTELAEIQKTEIHEKIDLYLTNVTLKSCIEKYTRRLYNLCRMIDLDSEDELFEEDYFEEVCYGVPDRLLSSQINDKKEPMEVSTGSIKAKNNTVENKFVVQPQVSNEIENETINETASKWSTRLRTSLNTNGLLSSDTSNCVNNSSPRKISKATRSRLILKETISNMNLSEIDFKRQIGANNRCKDKGIGIIQSTDNHQPVANVIVTQNTHISKQPFSSLFNI